MREGIDSRLKSRWEREARMWNVRTKRSSFHVETALPEGRIITRHFFANCRVRERARSREAEDD